MTTPQLVVTLRHLRAAGMCASGARSFCARHGLDWPRFIKEGLPVELVEATGDPMAKQVAEIARDQ